MRIPSVELFICSFSPFLNLFRKCLSIFPNCFLSNFKIINIISMTLHQQSQLCKIIFLFSSNSTWFLFWDLILPGRGVTISINLPISLLPPCLGLYVNVWSMYDAKAWEGGTFVLKCAGSGCSINALAGSDHPSSVVPLEGHGSHVHGPILSDISLNFMGARIWDSFPRVERLCFLPSFSQVFGLYPKPLSSLAG